MVVLVTDFCQPGHLSIPVRIFQTVEMGAEISTRPFDCTGAYSLIGIFISLLGGLLMYLLNS